MKLTSPSLLSPRSPSSECPSIDQAGKIQRDKVLQLLLLRQLESEHEDEVVYGIVRGASSWVGEREEEEGRLERESLPVSSSMSSFFYTFISER